MGRKCSVPGCKSNYNKSGEYISSFLYPEEETRKHLWIKKINRKNFVPSKTAVVCIHHFSDKFIIREDSAVRDDGTVLRVPRKKPKLTPDAYPSLFPNQPSYLSEDPQPKRRTPSERFNDILQRDEKNFLDWCSKDIIDTYQNFRNSYTSKLGNNWLSVEQADYILIYKLELSDIPNISVAFKVKNDLTVVIWHGSILLDSKPFEFILDKENKLNRWTKLDCLLNLLDKYDQNRIPFKDQLNHVVKILHEHRKEMEKGEGKRVFYIDIVIEQISLLMAKKYLYSPNYLLFAAKFYFSYPTAYIFIRNSKILILPHPVYLKKLSSPFKSNNSLDNNNHISYLKKKTQFLDDNEKIVSLLLDEIYVNPTISYKSGEIVGIADHSVNEATTIQAFMITSIFSKNKDIIALVPVKNQNADLLFSNTMKVLTVLKQLNYSVLCIISDNNRINRNMFTKMCNGNLSSFIQNPVQPENKLFFLFDTVHLIKSVRNNWLKQTTEKETLFFPDPNDFSKISKASIKPIKDIYESEKKSVTKTAPKLSQKVLYPSSFEKQNVLYALNLFHESTQAALSLNDKTNEYSGTITFLDFILKWWKIVNVKHRQKGLKFNDDFCNPVENANDKNVQFLERFRNWLMSWETLNSLELAERKSLGLPSKGGKLTKETHFALQFTTASLIELIIHIFNEYNPKYILLGKFQTDPLEARFGQYRQMSGANYNVSCQQVFESESKLKIISWIHLYSEKQGEFKLKHLELFKVEDFHGENNVPNILYETFNCVHDELNLNQQSVFIYIAGYVGKQVCKQLTCEKCHKILILDKNIEYESTDSEIKQYFLFIDRGGLKWPTKFVIQIVVETYLIFIKLITEKYEDIFLGCKNQKFVLEQLTLEKLCLMSLIPETQCICENNLELLAKKCLSISSNILINNYCKIKNDKIKTNSKRKLSTLTI